MRPPETMEERLAYARGLTRTTGVVHDIQLYQMKRYPYLADPDLRPGDPKNPTKSGVEIRLDSEKKVLEYRLVSGPRARAARLKTKRYRKGMEAVAGWVRMLLGDEWSVEISVDGQAIYQVEGKEEDVEPPRPAGGASPAKPRVRTG